MNDLDRRPARRAIFATVAPLLVASLPIGCGIRELPPPPTPDVAMPRLRRPAEPVEPGKGRLVLDVADGPTRVDLILARDDAHARSSYAFAEAEAEHKALLCRTPCVVDLPQGSHELRFTYGDRTETDIVDVGPAPSVYRRRMGDVRTHDDLAIGGTLAATFGFLGAALGGVAWGAYAHDDSDGGRSAVRIAEPVTIASGAVMILGVVLATAGRTEVQHGSSVQWTLPAAPDPRADRR